MIALADWLPAFENPAVTAPTVCAQASGEIAGRCRGPAAITLFSSWVSEAPASGLTSLV
jgi:hypothetical protein